MLWGPEWSHSARATIPYFIFPKKHIYSWILFNFPLLICFHRSFWRPDDSSIAVNTVQGCTHHSVWCLLSSLIAFSVQKNRLYFLMQHLSLYWGGWLVQLIEIDPVKAVARWFEGLLDWKSNVYLFGNTFDFQSIFFEHCIKKVWFHICIKI